MRVRERERVHERVRTCVCTWPRPFCHPIMMGGILTAATLSALFYQLQGCTRRYTTYVWQCVRVCVCVCVCVFARVRTVQYGAVRVVTVGYPLILLV